jgi:hypothetical protein
MARHARRYARRNASAIRRSRVGARVPRSARRPRKTAAAVFSPPGMRETLIFGRQGAKKQHMIIPSQQAWGGAALGIAGGTLLGGALVTRAGVRAVKRRRARKRSRQRRDSTGRFR